MPVEVRVRQRVPLSQSAACDRNTVVSPSRKVRRNGRHAGGAARSASARGTRRWPSATSSAAPSPARPTAESICTPGRRSASPRTKAFTSQVAVLTMLALYFGRLRHLIQRKAAHDRRAAGPAGPRSGQALRDATTRSGDRRNNILTCDNFLYLGRQYNLSRRAGRALEAQGNQLHPRRGLSRGRDEARADRAGRSRTRRASSDPARRACTTR